QQPRHVDSQGRAVAPRRLAGPRAAPGSGAGDDRRSARVERLRGALRPLAVGVVHRHARGGPALRAADGAPEAGAPARDRHRVLQRRRPADPEDLRAGCGRKGRAHLRPARRAGPVMDASRESVKRLAIGALWAIWAVLFALLLMLLFVPGAEGFAVGR